MTDIRSIVDKETTPVKLIADLMFLYGKNWTNRYSQDLNDALLDTLIQSLRIKLVRIQPGDYVRITDKEAMRLEVPELRLYELNQDTYLVTSTQRVPGDTQIVWAECLLNKTGKSVGLPQKFLERVQE